jgi:hypothetical protein
VGCRTDSRGAFLAANIRSNIDTARKRGHAVLTALTPPTWSTCLRLLQVYVRNRAAARQRRKCL